MSETRRSSRTTQSSSGRSSASRRSDAERISAVHNARNLGSGTGSRRSTASNRKRGRRRKRRPDFAKFLLILIAIVIVILCVAVALRGCSKDSKSDTKESENIPETEIVTEPETEIEAEITINGISVHGLTKSEAKEKLLDDIGWDMTVTYDGESKAVANLMEAKVDEVIDEAFEKGKADAYEISTDGLEDAIAAEAESIGSSWDVSAKNGSISSYDSSTGEFVFSGAQSGKTINRDKLVSDIGSAIASGKYDAKIEAAADTVAPEISEAEAKASFKRLGTYTTTTTSNKDRNENIRIASSALNGLIINPGEEFSFNKTTGNRTTDKGYRAAGAYVNGVLVEEPGGGVCQVSSTLYNAVVFSGLKTTERHAHSYEPSYVTPGEDAMVSYDGYSGPDMRFVNTSKTAIGIKTSFSNQKLTISIYGNPILEDGVTLSMKSEKVKEYDPPTPTYEEDQTLEEGVEVVVKAATPGSLWVTNLVTKKDGVVVSDEFFHNSTYNGKAATIKRNTSGVVITTEAATEETSPAETTAAESTETETSAAPTTAAPTQASVPNGPGYVEESSSASYGPGDPVPTTAAETTAASPAETTAASPIAPISPADTPAAGQTETSSGPGDVGTILPNG